MGGGGPRGRTGAQWAQRGGAARTRPVLVLARPRRRPGRIVREAGRVDRVLVVVIFCRARRLAQQGVRGAQMGGGKEARRAPSRNAISCAALCTSGSSGSLFFSRADLISLLTSFNSRRTAARTRRRARSAMHGPTLVRWRATLACGGKRGGAPASRWLMIERRRSRHVSRCKHRRCWSLSHFPHTLRRLSLRRNPIVTAGPRRRRRLSHAFLCPEPRLCRRATHEPAEAETGGGGGEGVDLGQLGEAAKKNYVMRFAPVPAEAKGDGTKSASTP